ncbi:hypothetical protein [Pseudomonas sp. L-22-4S-12]|uniref:hypothetical protein n=1 Tax=Pseudomonas sp. L-22-4S-12 TaxID=2610893 RepID=UPI001C49923B|nr:hypothetical protein [Pseudomonas sp. L-22-4S-12]
MSDEELDVWADIFYQAKVSGLADVAFSQFIGNPFTHLSPAIHTTDRPEKQKPHLRLAYSKDASPVLRASNGTELAAQPSEFSE